MDRGPGSARMDSGRERDLVSRSRVDAAAFGELYDFYLPRIYGFVVRRVGERDAAEDLTAMTFERALGAVRRDDFRNESFGGFLYRVASNAIVDHARRGKRTVPLGMRASDWDEAADGGPSRNGNGHEALLGDEAAAAALGAALDREVLRRALRDLPEGHRRVLVMKFYDGLETDELCAALACSRPTLAVKLHRALRALRAAARDSIDVA
ncbi:MAG: sigma-70 family RNA polymerase sigma factor [Chloroflexi bacterium]|nr:sigma-70 family RNA polymerase sigma factor [Chloroflexota bacterium]